MRGVAVAALVSLAAVALADRGKESQDSLQTDLRWTTLAREPFRLIVPRNVRGNDWAELLATLRAKGRAMPIKDSLIAGTALAHDLAVVTLNRRDFDAAGVVVVDPTAAEPGR